MGQVIQMRTSDDDAPAATPAGARVASGDLRAQLLVLVPGTRAELARQVGRDTSDRTLRRRLSDLVDDGRLELGVDGVYRPVVVEAEPDPELPEGFDGYAFPAHFDHESRQLFVVKLSEHAIDSSTDIELLESYVGELQTARLAHQEVAQSGAYLRGKGGRVYKHPAVDVATAAERLAQQLRDALVKLDERKRAAAANGTQLGLDFEIGGDA